MEQIVVENLYKTYRIGKRDGGFFTALKGIFSREYETIQALKKISFSIDKGELVGYIGPNGAGKSTTVKILSGILVPDGGRCLVEGRVPWQERIDHVRDIGVVFGQRTQLWWDLPVIDSFELLRDIYKIPHQQYIATKEELVSTLEIEDLLQKPVRQLSLGQRMRCEFAASLLHSPSILFLDEPTIGLDAVSKLAVRKFIKKINQEKKVTVILTTHDMDDIEALCERVIVIGKGEILFDGTPEDLREEVTNERHLIVDLDEEIYDVKLDHVTLVKTEGKRVCFSYNPEEISTSELISRVSKEYPVRDLFVENPSIEEIIADLYGKWRI